MRWLANENFPLASIMKLRSAGHDVTAILSESPGIMDDEVLARAARENRLILTFDRDYGELIFKRKLPPPPGVIYFRFIPRTPEEPAERLMQVLAIAGLVVEGRFPPSSVVTCANVCCRDPDVAVDELTAIGCARSAQKRAGGVDDIRPLPRK